MATILPLHTLPHMEQQTPWNHPSKTWRLASYEAPTERRRAPDRRETGRRRAMGDRRRKNLRALGSLFKL